MSKSLLCLTDEMTMLRNEIDLIASQNGGEVPDEMLDKLMETQLACTEKINGVLEYMDTIDNAVESWEKKLEAIKSKITGAKAMKDRMRFNIHRYMTANKIDQLKADKTISISKVKDKTDIDVKALPKEYKTTQIEEIALKDLINADLKAGKVIPGVNVETGRTTVRIQ
jgi:hypothetical protein